MPATLAYDSAENIIYMSFLKHEELNTRAEITAHYDRVLSFWRANAGSRKSYFVVDFDNIQINVTELDFYAQQTKRAHQICAITSVRYGGSSLQRTVTRLAGMKIHQPSNIYATKEEALDVVRALRAGEVKVKDAP